jgi:hypothetical protein
MKIKGKRRWNREKKGIPGMPLDLGSGCQSMLLIVEEWWMVDQNNAWICNELYLKISQEYSINLKNSINPFLRVKKPSSHFKNIIKPN